MNITLLLFLFVCDYCRKETSSDILSDKLFDSFESHSFDGPRAVVPVAAKKVTFILKARSREEHTIIVQ